MDEWLVGAVEQQQLAFVMNGKSGPHSGPTAGSRACLGSLAGYGTRALPDAGPGGAGQGSDGAAGHTDAMLLIRLESHVTPTMQGDAPERIGAMLSANSPTASFENGLDTGSA